ncbi:MAG: methylated-DNA--[protein]-cysteine S-methyltransferase [Myxococcota bacterium]|nr:methylated-DNA--[protein]-cysteine S-methyltransferase [Myxococcota bacterium]
MDVIHTAEFDSPIGSLRIASTSTGLAYIQLPQANGRGFDGWRTRHAPSAVVKQGFEPNRASGAQIIEFLEGKREAFDLPLDLRGTDFQVAVYEEVARIPFGETRSYKQIAAAIGRPTATRAVGAANGANPVSLVVPCHRVIATNGHLHGYGGGLDLKAKLLAMERGLKSGQGRLL